MAKDADARLIHRIQTDAVDRLWLGGRSRSNVSIDRRVLERGTTLDLQVRKLEIERDSVVVFVDDAPLENWGHPCRYLLYEPRNAELYATVDAMFPPDLVQKKTPFEVFHEPTVFARPEKLWRVDPFPRVPFWRRSNWYAVLFSGASNNRHTNDLEFLYRVLRNDYDVPADQIYVLNYDGTVDYSGSPQPPTTWPGDGTAYTMTVNAPGTKAELESVFDELAGRLGEDDNLLIHTNNHGGDSPESTLITYAGSNYTSTDFAAKLGELPEFSCLMVMMEQCFAGGFNAPIIANSTAHYTSVASAAIATQTSIGGADFDPFARDWIAALHRAAPDGGPLASDPDTDGDGVVSAREAFVYADSVHHPHDTPNFSVSSYAGGGCHLGVRPPRWLIPELQVLIDRFWLDPGPLREAFARIEEVMPSLSEVAFRELDHAAEVRSQIEARIQEVLR